MAAEVIQCAPPALVGHLSIEFERAQAITWVRIQMAQHGLTLIDLQAAGAIAWGGALP